MSGLCCVINFDGAPVDPDLLHKMTNAAAYRGPDGIFHWIENNVGLAYLAHHTTPEAVHERQPLVNQRKDIVLVADARVDNRQELMQDPRIKEILQRSKPTDADLILAAYDVWGEFSPRYIIGDFAFVLWDKHRQKLFAARDPVGVRQLYYYKNNMFLTIATSVGSILSIIRETPQINIGLLETTLAGNFEYWVSETAYDLIQRLPPSYALTTKSRSIKLHQYYNLGSANIPEYKSEADYIEHYKELFLQVVKSQLRVLGPPSVMGGAGLDSASIACAGDRLIDLGEISTPISIYFASFDQFPDADEREYFYKTINHCTHLTARKINCDDCWALQEFPEDRNYPYDDLDISNTDRAMMQKLMRNANQDGSRVMLSGVWGDQVNGQAAYRSPKYLNETPVSRLHKELHYFHVDYPFWLLLARAYLHPILPANLTLKLSAFLETSKPEYIIRGTPKTPHKYLSHPKSLKGSGEYIYTSITEGVVSARLAAYDRGSAYSQVEMRYPFLDRRLLDFLLQVPGHLFFRNGTNRYIQRQAMQSILPEPIRLRTSKANFTELYNVGLRFKEVKKIKTLLNDSHSVRMGILDEQQLKNAWDQYWKNEETFKRYLLWMLCIEIWMRNVSM